MTQCSSVDSYQRWKEPAASISKVEMKTEAPGSYETSAPVYKTSVTSQKLTHQ
jgi:hypothetical protein